MLMFAGHLIFILHIFAIAAGLIALHYGKSARAKLIRAAGIILVVFGISGLTCSTYYAYKYYSQGYYQQPFPPMMMDKMMGKMMMEPPASKNKKDEHNH